MKKKYKVKTGDNVIVIAGENKGRTGKIFKIDFAKERVFVEGVNIKTKHQKPNANNPQGGIIKKEAPIHISNVSHIDPKSSKPTRVSIEVQGDKKVRVSKKSKEVV